MPLKGYNISQHERPYRLSIFLIGVDHKVEATVEPTIGQVDLSNLAGT